MGDRRSAFTPETFVALTSARTNVTGKVFVRRSAVVVVQDELHGSIEGTRHRRTVVQLHSGHTRIVTESAEDVVRLLEEPTR